MQSRHGSPSRTPARGALLSDPDLPAPRVYAFDLTGSALGAFAVIPAIRHLGVEVSTLLVCALLLAGTVMEPRQGSSWLALLRTLGPPYGVEYVQWGPVARIEVSRMPPPVYLAAGWALPPPSTPRAPSSVPA